MITEIKSVHDGKPWPSPEDSPREAARKLLARGCMVVPLEHRHKEPVRGWRNLRITEGALEKHFPDGPDDKPRGVGVVMGRFSGGLVDVNLGAPEALRFAPLCLPPTTTFGRPSKPASHWLFYAWGVASEAFQDTGTELLSLRSNARKAEHTVFPPSLHEETGEPIVFDSMVDPIHLHPGELRRCVTRLTGMALLARHWEKLTHSHVVGALLKAEWDPIRIAELLKPIAGEAIGPVIETQAALHQAKKPICGWPAVEQVIGAKLVKDLKEWLNAKPIFRRGDFTERPVSDFLDDAPGDGLMVPHGYSLGPDETCTQIEDKNGELADTVITTAPLLITGRLRNHGDNVQHLRLSWGAYDGWHSVTCARDEAMDTAKLVKLAKSGLPVGSDNVKQLQKYFRHFDAANEQKIPTADVTSSMGWINDELFLWGPTSITPSGRTEAEFEATDPRKWPKQSIAFRAPDAATRKIAQAYHSAGTLDGWKEMVHSVAHLPGVLTAIYAALVPPLMRHVEIPNFLVDWHGTTSVGKTITIRAAAAAWGRPGDPSREPEIPSVLQRWNTTRVGIERVASTVLHMPVILDDTKSIPEKSRSDVLKVIYDITDGHSRIRGSITGLQESRLYRTVVLSTGESPLAEMITAGGTRARVLELQGSPFNGLDVDFVEHVNRAASTHYGHAGPALVEWLQQHPLDRAALQLRYVELRAEHQRAATVGAEARLGAYTAAIQLAAEVAHVLFGFCWPISPVIDGLRSTSHEAGTAAPPEVRALEHLASWAQAHEQEFRGRERLDRDGQPYAPAAGWAGWWDPSRAWDSIDFLPPRLLQVLQDAEFEPTACLRAWAASGALERPADGKHLAAQRKQNGQKIRVYRITRAALEAEPAPAEPAPAAQPTQIELPADGCVTPG